MTPDSHTAAAYDTVASKYEKRFLDELDDKPRDRELLDGLAARASGLVLDVGSGPGQIGHRVRQAGRPVLAVDLSHGMAARAGRRLDGAVVADMLNLPVADTSIADILAFYSVIHLPRAALRHALAEFARVLTPGGHVLVTAHEGAGEVQVTHFLDHEVALAATFFSLDELIDAVAEANLELVLAERRHPYSQEGSTVRLYVEAAK